MLVPAGLRVASRLELCPPLLAAPCLPQAAVLKEDLAGARAQLAELERHYGMKEGSASAGAALLELSGKK